jgi:uncharacterized protein
MSDEASNVAVLKEAYRRWHDSRGGSVDHWMTICDEDIQFGSLAQEPPGANYLRAYDNRTALTQYFEGLTRDWEMIEYVVDHLVAQGDRVVMLGRCSFRFRKTGKVVSTPKAESWRFFNGKAIEFYEYYDTGRLRDAMS